MQLWSVGSIHCRGHRNFTGGDQPARCRDRSELAVRKFGLILDGTRATGRSLVAAVRGSPVWNAMQRLFDANSDFVVSPHHLSVVIQMPKVGLSVMEGRVVPWLVAKGDEMPADHLCSELVRGARGSWCQHVTRAFSTFSPTKDRQRGWERLSLISQPVARTYRF